MGAGHSMKKFHLVDFAAHFQKGFRNHMVPITELPTLMEAFEHYGCYATYFFYSDEMLTHMGSHATDSPPTIAGFRGKVWAPSLPIDLDDPDLSVALQATRSLASLFIDRWEIDPNGLQVYFSGSKGFHLMLDTRLFGRVVPSKSLPLLFASMRQHLAQELPGRERETIDMGIKDRVRLLRLPNTIHEKSGLYKVLLPLPELHRLSQDEIRDFARAPQPLPTTDDTGLLSKIQLEENPAASRLFRRVRRQVCQITRKPFVYRFRRPEDLRITGFSCAGIQALWESHVGPGSRNNCAIRLASEFRLCGLTEEETHEKIFEWNTKNAIELPLQELKNVVRSAYQHPFPYRFGCRDGILRRFCALATLADCQRHVAGHGQGQPAGNNPYPREKGGSRIRACF